MAASMDPKAGFKQDMVVSTRYRNDLPPPPMPPKLLDIDNGGLAQYLPTSFASAMARREEPNIEVDAEGGMPGMPPSASTSMFGSSRLAMAEAKLVGRYWARPPLSI